jgi:hypothetical protein
VGKYAFNIFKQKELWLFVTQNAKTFIPQSPPGILKPLSFSSNTPGLTGSSSAEETEVRNVCCVDFCGIAESFVLWEVFFVDLDCITIDLGISDALSPVSDCLFKPPIPENNDKYLILNCGIFYALRLEC